MYIGPILFLIVGLMIMADGISSYTFESRFMKQDVSITKGRIIQIHKRRHKNIRENTRIYYPEVEYFVKDKLVIHSIVRNHIDGKYHVGDEINIAYKNNRDSNFIILENKYIKNSGLVGIVFGSIFVLAGIANLILMIILSS